MHRSNPGGVLSRPSVPPFKSRREQILQSAGASKRRPQTAGAAAGPDTDRTSSSNPSSPSSRAQADDSIASTGRSSAHGSTLSWTRAERSPAWSLGSPAAWSTGRTNAEARASARVALQNYRAAFDLMRLRSGSGSGTGWTDDDSPVANKAAPRQQQSPFQGGLPSGGTAAADALASSSPENDAAIQQLTKKVAQLEAGLSALLSGQAIPPAAAAALIAAITRMRPSSAGHSSRKSAVLSLGGGGGGSGASGKGVSRSSGGRNPADGTAISAGGGQRVGSSQDGHASATKRLQLEQRADELDSVIKAINQV